MLDELDIQIDKIYDTYNILMKIGDFFTIDAQLESIDVSVVPVEVLLTYLTASSWAKPYLKNRVGFYERVRWFLKFKYPHRWRNMLHGLEQLVMQ